MQIILNGTKHIIEERITIHDLISTLNIVNNKIAIAVNDDIIPKSRYLNTWLNENDKVEIVIAFQGG
jgi:sulfur carrier protein